MKCSEDSLYFGLFVLTDSYLHNSLGINISSLLSEVDIISTWIIITSSSLRYVLNVAPLIDTRVVGIFNAYCTHGMIIRKSYGQWVTTADHNESFVKWKHTKLEYQWPV
jgi:hypothetical protein